MIVKLATFAFCSGFFARCSAVRANNSIDEVKNQDLDWSGCGKKSGVGAWWCTSVPGCAIEKVWLDTPRQKCRFTEEYKLQPKQIPRFFRVELARLEEKSKTFAVSGCLFGGWWAKCYRRVRQIGRLLKYINRAVTKAKEVGESHPAYAIVTSTATSDAMARIPQNLAQGFEKHEAGKANGVSFGQALQAMLKLPDAMKDLEAAAAAENVSASEQQKETMEKVLTVEAMLKTTGVSLSTEQRAVLHAKLDAVGDMPDSESLIDEEVSVLDNAFQGANDANMRDLEKQELSHSLIDLEEPEDAEASKEVAKTETSLMERAEGNQAVATLGTGILKLIFKYGLGWLVSRIAWLFLALVAAFLVPVRIVSFMFLFATCTLTKFLGWMLNDLGYNILWEGEYQKAGEHFLQIGRCAPMMWDVVGFDPTGGVDDIFIQPGRFASKRTGVYHWYRRSKGMCEGVTCGLNAKCVAGDCVCNAGFYPVADTTDCDLMSTENGCVCKASWTTTFFVRLARYGCPFSEYKCQVDTKHPSFESCLHKINANEYAKYRNSQPTLDPCTPSKYRAKVAPVNANLIGMVSTSVKQKID